MYAEYLRFVGMTPVVASCQREALALAVTVHPSVIVLDYGSPRVDEASGLIREIRTQDSIKDTPIVVVSTRTSPADRERALDAGCDTFLLKPVLPDTLAQEIRRAADLTTRRGQHAGAA
jgi:CheY-like chemotaxis protein